MVSLSNLSIDSNEIVYFLKKGIQFKEVCQKIIYQGIINQAAQQKGLTVTPEEIQVEADRQRYENRLEKASDMLAWLADQMIMPEDWEAGIRDHLLAQKLAESLFGKEVEKLFAQSKVDFDQVLLYHLVVQDSKIAQELFYQIQEWEISFYEAAHLYDIDEQRRQNCGFEGKLYRWNLKPDIAAVVFGSPIGEVIGPLHTEQGYHLFLIEEFIPANLTLQKRQELLDGMFNEWLANELNYILHNKIE